MAEKDMEIQIYYKETVRLRELLEERSIAQVSTPLAAACTLAEAAAVLSGSVQDEEDEAIQESEETIQELDGRVTLLGSRCCCFTAAAEFELEGTESFAAGLTVRVLLV